MILNKIIEKEPSTIPDKRENIEATAGSEHISILDLKQVVVR